MFESKLKRLDREESGFKRRPLTCYDATRFGYDQRLRRRPRRPLTTMPPSRARASKKVRVADSDSDNDTEPDATPKPPNRTLSKKRISDAYDASFTSDNGRAALKGINMNDDAAEKRRRRKSARVPLPEDEAGPSSEGNAPEDVRAAAHAKQKQQLLSIAQQPEINVPLDVMNSNFEEWMKMATDNVCLSLCVFVHTYSVYYYAENQCCQFMEFCID